MPESPMSETIDPESWEEAELGRIMEIRKPEMTPEFATGWMLDKPYEIQQMAREFPPATMLVCEAMLVWVVAYADPDWVLISHINPGFDLKRSMEHRGAVRIDELRQAVGGRA